MYLRYLKPTGLVRHILYIYTSIYINVLDVRIIGKDFFYFSLYDYNKIILYIYIFTRVLIHSGFNKNTGWKQYVLI